MLCIPAVYFKAIADLLNLRYKGFCSHSILPKFAASSYLSQVWEHHNLSVPSSTSEQKAQVDLWVREAK